MPQRRLRQSDIARFQAFNNASNSLQQLFQMLLGNKLLEQRQQASDERILDRQERMAKLRLEAEQAQQARTDQRNLETDIRQASTLDTPALAQLSRSLPQGNFQVGTRRLLNERNIIPIETANTSGVNAPPGEAGFVAPSVTAPTRESLRRAGEAKDTLAGLSPEIVAAEARKAGALREAQTAADARVQKREGIGPFIQPPPGLVGKVGEQGLAFINQTAANIATGPEATAARESAQRSQIALRLNEQSKTDPNLNQANVDAAIARAAARYLEPDRLSDADFDQIVGIGDRTTIESVRLASQRLLNNQSASLTDSERETLLRIISSGSELSKRMFQNVATTRIRSLEQVLELAPGSLESIITVPQLEIPAGGGSNDPFELARQQAGR